MEFKSFLDKKIPKFVSEGILNVQQTECNLCAGCGNIFSLGEAQVSNSCNCCGSNESVKRVIDCMCLDASQLDTITGEGVISKIINPVSKEFRSALKNRFGQFPNTLLASRTNREGGYSLEHFGLPN